MTVRVLEVVDRLGVPRLADAEETRGPEAVLGHDDQVDEEAGAGLNEADLAVGHRDETRVDELVAQRVARLALHDVRLGLLVGERDGGHHVRAQVNAEDGDGAERQWNIGQYEEQEWSDLGYVGGERVGDGLLQVVEDEATLLHAGHDRGEVVVEQDHVGRLFAHVAAGDAHGDADVGLLERRRVVDAVAGDGHDGALALTALHNDQLLLRRGAREHNLRVVAQQVVNLDRRHVLQVVAVHHARLGVARIHLAHGHAQAGRDVLDRLVVLADDAHALGNGLGRDRMITCHHDNLFFHNITKHQVISSLLIGENKQLIIY